ncbi:hypothetical protein RR48_12916 [Papilio machaon]|uniref:Uncharacterized protein n=1 Tax=Papilio machaon TaxID=76193 RepID=A0A194QRR1_PAPMA|nr:hypothetical protein RR48_12916 [Papilio machaon]
MSAIIKFELKELRKLTNDKNSCVVERKVTQNLALQPWCLGNLKESIKKLLDYKIGKYDKEVFNVVIPRPTEEPGNKWIGTTIDEGQEVVFRIVVLDLYGALPYIRGELDERWIENEYEEEIMDSKPSKSKVIDVSYVDFNKTKPNVAERAIGDGCEQVTPQVKSKSLKRKDSRNRNGSIDDSNQEITNGQHDDVKSVVTEKSKTKRHSKHEDAVRQIETSTKVSKKQKRI